MSDGSAAADDSDLLARLRAAGIPDETLQKAAKHARRLCAGVGPLEGGTLDPRSGLEHQQLMASLAQEASR